MRKAMVDYAELDQPSILQYVFYPRKDFSPCPPNAFDTLVPVEDGVSISCRFYLANQERPWILYFHGNGEVVSDYDEIAPVYNQLGLNFTVADYRGYGASTGTPTLTALVHDCHVILGAVGKELSRKKLNTDLWIMGRSLGSISAIELACEHQNALRGFIIDSGFPSVVRIVSHLGIPAYGIDLEKIDREYLEKIKKILLPALILHGENDTLVPLQNARDLYDHLGTSDKELLVIPGATHNDIMIVGFKEYFKAVQRFVERTSKAR